MLLQEVRVSRTFPTNVWMKLGPGATLRDISLQTVEQLVLQDWPQDKHSTPACALPSFDLRHSLSILDGILLKGEADVIPSELRTSIKNHILVAKVCCVEQEEMCFGQEYIVT